MGAGVSGCEVAWACARGGVDTLLVTTSLDTAYAVAGERVRLDPPPGTLMETVVPPLRDGDGWIDGWALHRAAKRALEHEPYLHLLQSNVEGLRFDASGRVCGVRTWEGVDRTGDRVALCAGSFLRARLTIGSLTERAGRLGEMAYDDLYLDLAGRGVPFRDEQLDAAPEGGALPYRVACRVLDARGRAEDGVGVRALPGVVAAGVCARGALTYEAAAADGAHLAQVLVSRARSRAPGPPEA